MNIKMGEKIKFLRKARSISQEVLAQYLGVSFQSVSKWETGASMPDVALIPAIASFFEVSTDELFNFNVLETEKRVMELCSAAAEYRYSDPARSEQMLRDGLKQFPGNDIILTNMLYTMRTPERSQEVVDLCTVIIESTKNDDLKYDALRILAETYKSMGEYSLVKSTIDRIPELYFTKLELDAKLLEGEDKVPSAILQKNMAAELLADMLLCLADHYEKTGQIEQAKCQLTLAHGLCELMRNDLPSESEWENFYEYYGKEAAETIAKRLAAL